MKLVVDLGNTLKKVSVFAGNTQKYIECAENIENSIETIFTTFSVTSAIISSVIPDFRKLAGLISAKCPLLILDDHTPVPIKNAYLSPETLGKDRLASAVAAATMFPGENVLIIDAGSCIKYDFIDSSATYHGGAISPGLHMRLKALHTFTGKLPLIQLSGNIQLTGKNTQQSILSGVVNGAVAETDGIIEQYRIQYPDIKVILSGGDSAYLVNKLKSKIFAVSNMVLLGLKIILDYNDDIKQK
ncbi:MAG TPA: type III pantothenate kinase [Bacteroidales bacterium]|nr:type III pantothenate kinase [Bacteroidales bacterium]